MKQRLLVLALVTGCIVLGVAAFLVWTGQDRTPPEITIEEADIDYTEGDDYEVLLKGVSAVDDKDGDVSGQVFIDKIVPAEEGSAIVYYGVMDQSNNVGTAKRKITYRTSEQDTEETASQDIQPNGNIPVLTLNTDQTTIAAGTEFDVLSVVQDVTDDIDDRDSLFQWITVDGWYDVNAAGTYELHYFVTDSEGNVSEPCTLMLTVE